MRKSQLGNITITFPEAESENFDIDALAKLYGGNIVGGEYADNGTETHPSARKEHTFSVGDGVKFSPISVTSISNTHHTGTDVYYNLNGQRISQPQRGTNIINGKKVIR